MKKKARGIHVTLEKCRAEISRLLERKDALEAQARAQREALTSVERGLELVTTERDNAYLETKGIRAHRDRLLVQLEESRAALPRAITAMLHPVSMSRSGEA